MKKNSIVFLICTILLFVCSCSNNKVHGKYYSIYDNSIYYNFIDDSNYITNDSFDFTENDNTGTGTYEIDNGYITLHKNGDESSCFQFGYILKKYIGNLWEGKIPTQYEESMATTILVDAFKLTYVFNEDGTYNFYELDDNNNMIYSEDGTYEIIGGQVICTYNNETQSIFETINNKVYSIEYIKEK